MLKDGNGGGWVESLAEISANKNLFGDERVNEFGRKFGGAQNIYKKAKKYIVEHSEK